MSEHPAFIRRLLSTSGWGYFEPYDDVERLAADWPMNGDRQWAIDCVAWLDGYLATNPTKSEIVRLIFSGWHESGLLTDEAQFPVLLKAIRDRLVREIPNWKHEYYGHYPFDP